MEKKLAISLNDLKAWKSHIEDGEIEKVYHQIENLIAKEEALLFKKGQWLFDQAFKKVAKAKADVKAGDKTVKVDDEAIHSFSIASSQLASEKQVEREIHRRRHFNSTYYKCFKEDQLV